MSRDLIMERMEDMVKDQLEKLVQFELYDKNLMQAINIKVVPTVAYAMNIIKFTKTELAELDIIVKRVLRDRKMHGRICSDERLFYLGNMEERD